MPLIMEMQEGEDMFVRDEQYVLSDVRDSEFKLTRTRDKKVFDVTDRRMVELEPQVKACCGLGNFRKTAKVIVDAPRDILVRRGEIYRKGRR